ncbi:S-adenosylmethionine/arginine decarboxylase-like enzyme [Bradyrhizobium sp. USDA 4501]
MILGRHIKAVGIGDPDRLRSMSGIKGLLDDLVEALNMRALGSPHIYEVEEDIRRMNCEPFKDEGGVTGIVVLSTSHCAIHTWPLQSQFVLDVFSCRKFNPSVVVDLVSRAFVTKSLRTTDLSHSLDLEAEAQPMPAAGTAVTADQSAISPIVLATPRRVGGKD